MMGRSIESRFVRFRRKGDPAALAAVFDATAPELLRVAMHLSRDPAAAEDLLQRTFLTAIERAASFDARERLVPWLLGILGNHAKEAARKDRRTVDPSRLEPRESADPAATAERAELSEEAWRAIDAIEDPARSVLVLRWRHGLEPAEIANALGIPPATVRSHLHRGLERVRRAVPVAFAVAASGPVPVVRGLPAVRATVLARAEALGPALAASAAAVVATGGLLVGKKTLVAAAILLLAGGGGAAWWATRPSAEVLPAAPPRPLAPPEAAPGLAAGARPPKPVEPTTPPPSKPANGPGLEVVVRWADGTPAANIGVAVLPGSAVDPTAFTTASTDAEGRHVFAGLPAGRTLVRTDRGVGKYVDVLEAGVTRLDLALASGVRIEGEVVDAAGSAVPGATVWLAGDGPRWSACLAGRADDKGSFALRDVQPDRRIFARGVTSAPSSVARLSGRAGDTVHMRLALGPTAGALVGRVVADALGPVGATGEGTPVAGARVLVGYEYGRPVDLPDGIQGEAAAPLLAVTGADGSFRVDGVAEGKTFVQVRAPGGGALHVTVPISRAPAVTTVTLRIGPSATIVGTVRDGVGAPVTGASVSSGEWHEFLNVRTTSGADGTYRLEGVRAGEQRFELDGATTTALAVSVGVRADGRYAGQASMWVNVKPGEETHWDPVLDAGAAVSVRAVDEDGRPLEGLRLWAGWMTSAQRVGTTDRDGRVTITGLPAGTYEIRAFGDSETPFAARRGFVTGQPEVEWRLRRDELPSARFSGVLLGPDGQPPKSAVFVPGSRRAGMGVHVAIDRDTGRFTSALLPPGEYDIEVQAPGLGRTPLGSRRLAPRETVDLGTIRLREPGSVVVKVTSADGVPHRGASVRLDAGLGSLFLMGLEEDGTGRVPKAPPGRYVVVALDPPAYGAVSGEVVVEDGREASVSLTLPAGRTVRLRLQPPAGSSLPLEWTADVTAEGAGAVLYPLRGNAWWESQSEPSLWLAPGRYRVRFRSEDGWKADAPFEVHESDPKDAVIPIVLSR